MARTKKRWSTVGVDRISNLPDDLIHKILSYTSIKQAIETSGLSSRWRYIWISMPYLNFSSKEFHTMPDFSKFVTNVQSRRNNQVEVSSAELAFHGKVSLVIVKRILKYAFSHNIQSLNITCLSDKKIKVKLPVLRSKSLKSLTLTGCSEGRFFTTPSTWELPALTTLTLCFITLCYENTDDKSAGMFSECANLKNLTLQACKIKGLDELNICHPGLSSLTLERGYKGVNVVTPQLKNLTIKQWLNIHLICTPNLSSLRYKGGCYQMKVYTDLLRLENVDICIYFPSFKEKESAHNLLTLLQQIGSAKFLALNWEIIKLFSSSVELISHQPSPLANLKSLKIYPATLLEETQSKVSMSTEVTNYLLDGSPGATFTMVLHKEMKAHPSRRFYEAILFNYKSVKSMDVFT